MPKVKDEVKQILLKAWQAAVQNEQIMYYDDTDCGEAPYFLRPDNIRPDEKAFIFDNKDRGRTTISFADVGDSKEELESLRRCFFNITKLEL